MWRMATYIRHISGERKNTLGHRWYRSYYLFIRLNGVNVSPKLKKQTGLKNLSVRFQHNLFHSASNNPHQLRKLLFHSKNVVVVVICNYVGYT